MGKHIEQHIVGFPELRNLSTLEGSIPFHIRPWLTDPETPLPAATDVTRQPQLPKARFRDSIILGVPLVGTFQAYAFGNTWEAGSLIVLPTRRYVAYALVSVSRLDAYEPLGCLYAVAPNKYIL